MTEEDDLSLPPPSDDDSGEDEPSSPPPGSPTHCKNLIEGDEDEELLPPPDDDDCLDDLTLPSLHSEDDMLFYEESDFDDNSDSYGEYLDIDELSDPEDWDDTSLSPPSSEGESEENLEMNERTEPSTCEVVDENAIILENEEQEACLENHIVYGKYFKMLKVGLPTEIVTMKMIQENIDPSLLQLDPKSPPPPNLRLTSLAKRHQRGAKHSKPAISDERLLDTGATSIASALFNCNEVQLQEKGVTTTNNESSVIRNFAKLNDLLLLKGDELDSKLDNKDKNEIATDAVSNTTDNGLDELLAGDETIERVPLNEHPTYSKYFKMMKFGTPKAAVEIKVIQDNINPVILTLDPNTLVNKNAIIRNHSAKAVVNQSLNKEPKVRKKKVFISAINNKTINQDSIWNDKEGDITIDEDEFNKLFTEKIDSNNSRPHAGSTNKISSSTSNKKTVTLISMKRAQNASIALARVKMSGSEMREKLLCCDANAFTVEHLRAMKEYLPNEEEARILRSYKGDVGLLSIAEKYMKEMLKVPGATVIIQSLVYQKQFVGRWHDCKVKLDIIEKCCDSIKLSLRLKKVLKTILKVVNQLNDEKNQGITVDSLLKLATVKAFDKKTSVLQYVVSLIYKHDQDALLFPEDLKHLDEAARQSLEVVIGEKTLLHKELQDNIDALTALIASSDCDAECLDNLKKTKDVLEKLFVMTAQLDQRTDNLQGKFKNVLNYFSEDGKMLSHEFFNPLHKFVIEFQNTKKLIDRLKQLEEKKLQRHHSAPATLTNVSNLNRGNAVKATDMMKDVMKNLKKTKTVDKSNIFVMKPLDCTNVDEQQLVEKNPKRTSVKLS